MGALPAGAPVIGQLRERVTFERPAIGSDGAGGGALAWLPVDTNPTVWARVEAQAGSEPVEAQTREGHVTWRVTLRRRDDIVTDWRLVWRGAVFDILGVLPDERRAYVTILARSGGAQ